MQGDRIFLKVIPSNVRVWHVHVHKYRDQMGFYTIWIHFMRNTIAKWKKPAREKALYMYT